MTRFKEQHRQVLMKHLKDLLIKLNRDEVSIEETMESLKGVLVSLNKLKANYKQ